MIRPSPSWLLLFLLALVPPGPPAGAAEADLHGLLFGDGYWMAASHDPGLEGRNGFWLRRIYVTLDPEVGGDFTARLRMEMASAGDFTSASKIEPFIKDAWLQWSRSGHAVIFGLSPTPTFATVEPAWGYRAVEKTPLDLQKFGGTRDFGIAVKGPLGAGGSAYYHVMLANGSGTGTETDEQKKVYGAVGFRPREGATLEVNADWEDLGEAARYTLQVLGACRGDAHRIGVLYARQTRTESGRPDVTRDVVSLFGAARVADRVRLVGRFDRYFDPAPAGIAYLPFDPTAKSSNLILAGVDLSPAEDVHLIPNVEAVIYGDAEDGSSPGADVMVRTTVFFAFD